MNIQQLRLQNIMGNFNNPSNYGINGPPSRFPDPNSMDTSYPPQQPSPDYTPVNIPEQDNTPVPPVMTQSLALADKDGKEHPAISEAYNRFKSIFDSFQPETRATDRFNNLLDNMPQINTPGIGRKIVAAGQALGNVGPHFTRTGGGPDAADRVLYAPYLQDMAAFKEKVGPFGEAAKEENTANVNERTLAGNMMAAQAKADDDDARSRDAEAKLAVTTARNADLKAIADEKSRVEQQRVNILQAIQMGATPEVINGHLIAFFKSTGKSVNLGEYKDQTKIDVQGMKDASDLAVQESKNTGNLATQGSKNAGNLATVGARGTTAKPTSEASVATGRVNKANAILANHPELKNYIIINGRNVTMNPPKDGLIFKTDPKLKTTYDQAKADIFSEGTTNTPVPSSTLKSFGSNIPDANPDLHQKATDYLTKAGLPVTEANIAHAIKTGRVK